MTRNANDTKARNMYRIAYRIVRNSLGGNGHTSMTENGQARQLALIEKHYPGMVERIVETLGEYSRLDRCRAERDLSIMRDVWAAAFADGAIAWDSGNNETLQWWAAQVA
jgi:hypothetical protein